MHWTNRLFAPAKTIALRAEEASRVWERRVCLTPSHVSALTDAGISVLVQPSARRCFKDAEYQAANAVLTQDLRPADLILGVKEPSLQELHKYAKAQQKWLSFWHCHKGQDYNRPLLNQMLQTNADFIDWELLTDAQGKRTTAFGWFAGYAGLCEGLSQLAVKALSVGSATPFLHLPRPYMHATIEDLQTSLRQLGHSIKKHGTGPRLGPVVVGVVGRGRVASGAVDALNAVGVQWLDPQELQSFVASTGHQDHHTLYAVQLTMKNYLKHESGRAFDREEYRASPASFVSTFGAEIAPYLTMVHNGAFWDPTCPRIMTDQDYKALHQRLAADGTAHQRFLQVADVSADWAGGLEFVKRPSTISEPAFILNDQGAENASAAQGSSTSIMSIEILPSELPIDASRHFSESIFDYVRTLCGLDGGEKHSATRQTSLDNAHLIRSGQLESQHAWLQGSLAETKRPTVQKPKRNVVLFGSGLVAEPAVKELLRRDDVELTIVTNDLPQGQQLSQGQAQVIALDVRDSAQLDALLQQQDCVISLLPAALHPIIAESCIRSRTNLVTASYESPAMEKLQQAAQEAGVVIINELGLDPGIDILSTMQLLDEAKQQQRNVTAFVSVCGGLPAPECSDVPLRYKFSWSPRGVLSASANSARYLLNGQEKCIASENLLHRHIKSVPTIPGFDLEMLPNRNALPYIDAYGLDRDHLKTIFRGTLRYKGFSQMLSAFGALGLTSTTPFAGRKPESWLEVLQGSMMLSGPNPSPSLIEAADEINAALHWLGLIPDSLSETPTFPGPFETPLDYLEQLLTFKLCYHPGERDLVLLQNEVTSISPSGQSQTDVASLILYGEAMPDGPTAMARTVGVPVALGATLLLDGAFQEPGVHTPTREQLWKPLLSLLEERGIQFKRSTRPEAQYGWLNV